MVTGDNYTIKKLSYEIGKFAKEGVLEPHGIENVDFSASFDLDNDKLPSELLKYNGDFSVRITVRGQGKTPREIGWLWDFYEFWCDNQCFNSNWGLKFDIYSGTDTNDVRDSSISIHNTEKFGSKEEWYANNTYPPKYR